MQRSRSQPWRGVLPIGTRVEVRSRYRGSWSSGFEIEQTSDGGYWLRRESDRYLLPSPFIADDIRPRD
jgi:hypothetical protein